MKINLGKGKKIVADETLFIQQGQHKVEFKLIWTENNADLHIRENGSTAQVMLHVDPVILFELADQLNLWAEMLETEHELEPPYPDQDPAAKLCRYCRMTIDNCICEYVDD